MATVPVVVPPLPIRRVFVVLDPGTPLPIFIASPPEVTGVPDPMLIVCVAAEGLPLPMLIVLPAVDCPRVIAPV